MDLEKHSSQRLSITLLKLFKVTCLIWRQNKMWAFKLGLVSFVHFRHENNAFGSRRHMIKIPYGSSICMIHTDSELHYKALLGTCSSSCLTRHWTQECSDQLTSWPGTRGYCSSTVLWMIWWHPCLIFVSFCELLFAGKSIYIPLISEICWL